MLVSSHVLDEVERFGSRVLVIAQGRLAAEGDFHAIRDLMDDRPHRLRVGTDAPGAGRRADGGGGGLGRAGGRRGGRVCWVWVCRSVVVDTVDVAALRRSVAVVAEERGARLLEVVPLDDDLESVFRYLVDRR